MSPFSVLEKGLFRWLVQVARMKSGMSYPEDGKSLESFMASQSTPSPQPSGPIPGPDDGQGSVVAERQASRVEPPPLYLVYLLNDDYTPMEFVVMVLQEYFQRDRESATQIMLKIHHEGRGACGVYPKDIAATKVELVLSASRRAGHPLQCTMEAA